MASTRKLPRPLNPIDTEIFFDACVPGVCEKTHTPQNQFCFYKTTFFLHGVKFCINLALFLCTVLIFSSILMNFSDFRYKNDWKFQLFWELSYIQVIYPKRKLKSFRNWFLSKKIRLVWEKNDKMRIFQFFAKKLGGLDIFDGRFLKIFNNKSKNQLHKQVLEGST